LIAKDLEFVSDITAEQQLIEELSKILHGLIRKLSSPNS